MRTMTESAQVSDLHVERYEYDTSWTVAVDLQALGISDDDVTIDCVGETAIVDIDSERLKTEFDLDLPGPDAESHLQNSVLVITQTE